MVITVLTFQSGNTSIPFSLFLSLVNLMHDDTGAILMFQESSILVVYFTVFIYQKCTPHLDTLNFGSWCRNGQGNLGVINSGYKFDQNKSHELYLFSPFFFWNIGRTWCKVIVSGMI